MLRERREEVVRRACRPATTAAGGLTKGVALAAMAALCAGTGVVGQAPGFGTAGESGMQAEGIPGRDVDDVRARGLYGGTTTFALAWADELEAGPGRTVRGHGLSAGTERETVGAEHNRCFGVVRGVEINDGLYVVSCELIEDRTRVVGRMTRWASA